MLKSKYKPIGVAWELTLACNMKCMHCGSHAGQKRKQELTTNEALNLCEQLKELKAKYINFTGGEAILRSDWVEIGQKVKDLGMQLSILSNGLAIDKKTISNFKKLHLYGVAISLDGGTSETHDTIRGVPGAFNKIITNLEMLKENGFPVSVITTVHRGNFKELPLIRDKILGKTKAWQIQIAVPIGRFPQKLILTKEEFYALAMFIASTKKKYPIKELAIMGAHSIGYHSKILRNTTVNPVWKGCQAGISVIGIESDGSIKGCLSLPENFVEGNIRKRSLAEIWNDPKLFTYTRKFSESDLKNQCKECKFRKTCKGGCSTASYSITGDLHCNPYCLHQIEKQLFN